MRGGGDIPRALVHRLRCESDACRIARGLRRADAIQESLAAEVQSTFGTDRRGGEFVVERVLGDLAVFGIGRDDGALAFEIDEVDFSVGDDRGCLERAAESLPPLDLTARGVEALGDSIVADEKELAAVIDGSRRIGAVTLIFPQNAVGGEASVAADARREGRPPFADRGKYDVSGDDRAGDRSVAFQPRQIPQLFAGSGIVGVEPRAAHHDDFGAVAYPTNDRRGVRVAPFFFGTGHAEGEPTFSPGSQFVRDDVARIRFFPKVGQRILHTHRDEQVADDDRTVCMPPPDGIGSIVVLHIATPYGIAVEIGHDQIAVSEVEYDITAVGRG